MLEEFSSNVCGSGETPCVFPVALADMLTNFRHGELESLNRYDALDKRFGSVLESQNRYVNGAAIEYLGHR